MISTNEVLLVPPAPPAAIPDGNLASEQEMIAAIFKHRVYNSDIEAYLRRLEFEVSCGRLTRSTCNRLHNAAVEALGMAVRKFNAQVEKFSARASFRLSAVSSLRN